MWKMPRSADTSGCLFLGVSLGGEVGELLNEIKKEERDGVDKTFEIQDELGDVLYYVVKFANHLGLTLEELMALNVSKLEKRYGKLSAK